MFLFEFLLHIDRYLVQITADYGGLTYLILFLIVFAETGFVFTPFLPGDSLLFAAGALASLGSLNVAGLLVLLWLAAFLGDTVNYWIGHFFGKKIIAHPKLPLNREHLAKAQKFYDKHGGKTIFLARFIPIVRTFAPFVAGIGKMEYKRFITFNATGGITWVAGFTLMGYFFGNLPWVKANFSLVVLAIIFLSVMPVFMAKH
ncbi:MAG: DedA family protein [Candidatus Beckwithbacteria bacterium]|nr:DedA family protein [Candidatus Beckwithbacteria bacterium]